MNNRHTAHPFWRGISSAILWIWSFLVVYPLLWTVIASVKSNAEFYQGKPWSLPHWPFHLGNYGDVWRNSHLGQYFLNSFVVTVASVLLSLLLAATTAYVLARYPFKGGSVLYVLYISSMMVPVVLTMIPLFFLLNTLHLINSLFGLALVYAVSAVPFGVFILHGFFQTIPKDLEESAMIDGASHFGTFFRIMLPLAKSGLITVAIMNTLNVWNEYILATVLLNDPAKYTLPVGIAVMQAEMQYRTEWGPLFAGLVLSMVPVFLLYARFQKQITGGITAGAVK